MYVFSHFPLFGALNFISVLSLKSSYKAGYAVIGASAVASLALVLM
jgi:hypothetical protein